MADLPTAYEIALKKCENLQTIVEKTPAKKHSKIATAIGALMVYAMASLSAIFPSKANAITVDGNVTQRLNSQPAIGEVVQLDRIVNDNLDTTLVDTTDTGGNFNFTTVGVEENVMPVVKQELKIAPNPSSTADISYSLSGKTRVSVSVYDQAGRLVKELVNSEQTGLQSVVFDGKDKHGNEIPNGIYFVRVATPNGYNDVKKMIHLKGKASGKVAAYDFVPLSAPKSNDTTYVLRISGSDIYARTDSGLIIPKDTTMNKVVIKNPNMAVEYALAKGFTLNDYNKLLDMALLDSMKSKNDTIAIDIAAYMNDSSLGFPNVLKNAMQDKIITNSDLETALKDMTVRFKSPAILLDTNGTYTSLSLADSVLLARFLDDIDNQFHGGISQELRDSVAAHVAGINNLVDLTKQIKTDVRLLANGTCGENTFKIVPLVNYWARQKGLGGIAWRTDAITNLPYTQNFDHTLLMLHDSTTDTLYYVCSTTNDFSTWGHGDYFRQDPCPEDTDYTYDQAFTLNLEYLQAKDRAGAASTRRGVLGDVIFSRDINYGSFVDCVTATDTACAEIVSETINNKISDKIKELDKKIKSIMELSGFTGKGFKYVVDFNNGKFEVYGVDNKTFLNIKNGN